MEQQHFTISATYIYTLLCFAEQASKCSSSGAGKRSGAPSYSYINHSQKKPITYTPISVIHRQGSSVFSLDYLRLLFRFPMARPWNMFGIICFGLSLQQYFLVFVALASSNVSKKELLLDSFFLIKFILFWVFFEMEEEIGFFIFYFFVFQVHIVYMGERKHGKPELVSKSHHQILSHILGRFTFPLFL